MYKSVKKVLMIRLHASTAKALLAQNIEVFAIGLSGRRTEADGDHLIEGLQYIQWNRSDNVIIDGVHLIAKLREIIRRESPDVIHVNALQDLLPVKLAVWKATCGRDQIPAIVAMSRHPKAAHNIIRIGLSAMQLRLLANGFVALSKIHKQKLMDSGVPSNKITVIPNPYDNDDWSLANKQYRGDSLSHQSKQIVYVATLCERKAQDVLIKAAGKVLDSYPNLEFEIIGGSILNESDYVESLHGLISKLGISKSVRFRGKVSHKEVIRSLIECDIFVFPTKAEMLPRAVIEAMMVGKPVIASAVDGILDLIIDHKTGILVQPGDPDGLATAICELVSKPRLANDLAESGKRFVESYCSPHRVGSMLIRFYMRVAKRK